MCLNYRGISTILKGLSSSRSGDIFFNSDYNEVLKFVIFRYSISRYKCCRPNETNFMDFGQKLRIFQQFYENKLIFYFHLGYTKKIQEKKLFNFLLATESPYMHRFSKSWSVLISAKSGQFEFVVRLYAILGDFLRFWAIFAKLQKIGSIFPYKCCFLTL